MVSVVPLFSTQHYMALSKFSKFSNSKNTIFEGLMKDWLCQISSLVKYRPNKQKQKNLSMYWADNRASI